MVIRIEFLKSYNSFKKIIQKKHLKILFIDFQMLCALMGFFLFLLFEGVFVNIQYVVEYLVQGFDVDWNANGKKKIFFPHHAYVFQDYV